MSSDVVHLIDDDTEVLQALSFLLATAGFAVQAHPSAAAFLESPSRVDAGCIVSDIRMPGMDGLELQRKLTAEGDRTPVIIMTAHADVALAVEAMKAGAVDFIEKPFDNEVLIAAIRSALARRSDDRARARQAAEFRERLALLTERERQVLDGLVAGKSNKIIAHDLNLSVRTVEGYRANVMAKMQAHSLSALIRMILAQ